METMVINGYTLQYKLGEGGMAEVWYAENGLGKPAAVKILQERLCGDADVVARFENEARLMVQLSHQNIRNIYDFSVINGRPCMLMEYLQGKDAAQRMKEGEGFSAGQLVQWWNDLVDALHYTHQKNIIHRDIKPSNLFITLGGEIKLLDFGIAKIKDNISVTQTGSRMGTLLYMSPEQVYDLKNLSYKTDIYSLAVTFYHLVLGKAPYDTTRISDFEVQENIVRKNIDTTALPEPWRSALPGYLFKNAEDRKDLKKIGESSTTTAEPVIFDASVLPPSAPAPPFYPTRRRSNAWVYLFLSLLVLAGVMVWAMNKDRMSRWLNAAKPARTTAAPAATPRPPSARPAPAVVPADTTISISDEGTTDQVITSVDIRESENDLKKIISDYYRSRSQCNSLHRFFSDTVKQYYRKSDEPIESIIRECENYHGKWQFTEADIKNESYVFTHHPNGDIFVDYSMLYKIKQKETDAWIPFNIDVSMVFDDNRKISRIVERRIEKL